MSGHLQHFCGSHLGAAWAACHGRGWQWGTTGGRKLPWAAGGGPRHCEAASSLKGPAGALGVFLYSDSLGRWAVWSASAQQFGSFAQGSQRGRSLRHWERWWWEGGQLWKDFPFRPTTPAGTRGQFLESTHPRCSFSASRGPPSRLWQHWGVPNHFLKCRVSLCSTVWWCH